MFIIKTTLSSWVVLRMRISAKDWEAIRQKKRSKYIAPDWKGEYRKEPMSNPPRDLWRHKKRYGIFFSPLGLEKKSRWGIYQPVKILKSATLFRASLYALELHQIIHECLVLSRISYEDDEQRILLDIYYETLSSAEISQFRSQTVATVMGTLGGLLGLWVSFGLNKCVLQGGYHLKPKAHLFASTRQMLYNDNGDTCTVRWLKYVRFGIARKIRCLNYFRFGFASIHR